MILFGKHSNTVGAVTKLELGTKPNNHLSVIYIGVFPKT